MAQKNYSQRKACELMGIAPRVYRYRSKRDDDAGLRKRLVELSSERRRFGYRRLHILLKREGWHVNWKRLYRLYKEEKLTGRKRGGRKRALGTRAPMAIPQDTNQRWSLDFVSDSLVDGRRFRILCVIDDFSRECLATVVDTSLSGIRVARELDIIAELRGYPCMIVSDNGTELTSNAILKWQRLNGITSHQVNSCRTALSKALTGASEMSVSMSISSRPCLQPENGLKHGELTTIPKDPIPPTMG